MASLTEFLEDSATMSKSSLGNTQVQSLGKSGAPPKAEWRTISIGKLETIKLAIIP